MYTSAAYHNAFIALTLTVSKTSNQHEELGSSCKTRDFADLSKLINWFEYDSHNPFDPESTELVALDSGMSVNEDVNSNNAEAIGMAIQEKLNNVSLHAASIERSGQAVTLNSLKPTLSIRDDKW